ncbi:hypothetical protein MKEN_01401000 [Mycena kentingensis (nom. inval.)]|nr:hypothetical protein MKEN_01401000 [Mycena kentingensis (nom. inval.)]
MYAHNSEANVGHTRPRPRMEQSAPHEERRRKRAYTAESASSGFVPIPTAQSPSPSRPRTLQLQLYQWVQIRDDDAESGIRAGQLALVVAPDTLLTVVPRARLARQLADDPRATYDQNTLAELALDDPRDLAAMVLPLPQPQPTPEELNTWERLATGTNAKWLHTAYCRVQGGALVPGCRVTVHGGPRRRTGFVMELLEGRKAVVRLSTQLDPLASNFVQLLQVPAREEDIIVVDTLNLRRHIFSGVLAAIVGDRVCVLRGPHRGALGRVYSISSTAAEDPLVRIDVDERRVEVPMSHLARCFLERDVVRIVHGAYAGEVGTVIRTFPVTESRRRAEQSHSGLEVYPLTRNEGASHNGCKMLKVLSQQVVFWDGRESSGKARTVVDPSMSPTGYARVLAQRTALWDEPPASPQTVRSPSTRYSPSSVSSEHTPTPTLSPASTGISIPVSAIGNDEGRWLCIPKLAGKRVDVIVLPIRHGRITNVQAEAVGRSGFIEIEAGRPLLDTALKAPLNVYVDGLQKRIRLSPKWLAPMRSALQLPVDVNQEDISIAQSGKGRVVIVGPDVRGSVQWLGEYANIVSIGQGPMEVVLVQFPREWWEPISQAYFPLQSLCRSTNLDGKQTKATRFY